MKGNSIDTESNSRKMAGYMKRMMSKEKLKSQILR